MREYQFRTTKLGIINTGIFRMEHRPSGFVVPSSIAQITFENQTPAVSDSLHIPSRGEAAMCGIDTQLTGADIAPTVERFTFTESSIVVFGQRAVSTCVEIIEEIEATNIAIAANPEVDNEAERDLITQIGRRIARHSAGYTEETPASSDSGTGMYL